MAAVVVLISIRPGTFVETRPIVCNDENDDGNKATSSDAVAAVSTITSSRSSAANPALTTCMTYDPGASCANAKCPSSPLIVAARAAPSNVTAAPATG